MAATAEHGTALVRKSEPSVGDMAGLRLNLSDTQLRQVKKIFEAGPPALSAPGARD